jgi:hypothetical protein
MGNWKRGYDDFYFSDEVIVPKTRCDWLESLSCFMSEESDANFNEAMRKILITRVQKNQDLLNHYLSWFYVQQKRVSKAFIQESFIYKRNPNHWF